MNEDNSNGGDRRSPEKIVESRESPTEIKNILLYATACVAGAVGGLLVGAIVDLTISPFIGLIRIGLSRTISSAIWGLSVLSGGATGMYIYKQGGLRAVLYSISYPVLSTIVYILSPSIGNVFIPDTLAIIPYSRVMSAMSLALILVANLAWRKVYTEYLRGAAARKIKS